MGRAGVEKRSLSYQPRARGKVWDKQPSFQVNLAQGRFCNLRTQAVRAYSEMRKGVTPRIDTAMQTLFSYGTLQFADVQQALFQRTLQGIHDQLKGYRKTRLEIPDHDGSMATYPVIDHTENPLDVVEGLVFEITAREMQQADEYEGDSYKRIVITLASGRQAWVYVRANPI